MDKKKVFEIGKWVLLVLMSVLIVFLIRDNKTLKTSFEAYKKDGTYLNMYQSQTIGQLKKTNRELYDSIKSKGGKDVKQAAIIKYAYIYDGDTTYVKRKLPSVGSILADVQKPGVIPNTPPQLKDSTYNFSRTSDSISYTLLVNAPYVNWYKMKFTVNDKLTLVTREENGQNETTISTQNGGGKITGGQFYVKPDNRNSFINRFSLGLQIGAGYGLISKKPDIYIGAGLSFRLSKMK